MMVAAYASAANAPGRYRPLINRRTLRCALRAERLHWRYCMNTCDLSRLAGLPILTSVCTFLLISQSAAGPLDPKLIPRQMTAAQIDAARNISDLLAIDVDKAATPSHIRGDLGTFRSEAIARDTDAA